MSPVVLSTPVPIVPTLASLGFCGGDKERPHVPPMSPPAGSFPSGSVLVGTLRQASEGDDVAWSWLLASSRVHGAGGQEHGSDYQTPALEQRHEAREHRQPEEHSPPRPGAAAP